MGFCHAQVCGTKAAEMQGFCVSVRSYVILGQMIRNHKLAASFDVADQCDEQIRALDAADFPAPAQAGTEANKPA